MNLRIRFFLLPLVLSGCGNPGGISDADYKEYKELGAPKILYSCLEMPMFGTDKEPNVTTSYVAGVGVNSTYNKILGDAKTRCNGEFKILDSKA